MRRMEIGYTAGLCTLVLLASPPAPAQTPSFRGLGPMPGAAFGTYGTGVSGDGSTVVGYGYVTGSQRRAFRWTNAGGYELIGDPGGDSTAADASLDGSTVVGQTLSPGNVYPYRAFRWTAADGMEWLPFYEAAAASDQGDVVVGQDVRWTAPGMTDSLGFLSANRSTAASDASPDGQVVVGDSRVAGANAYAHAFRWTPAGGMRDLGVTTGTESLGHGVSGDGSVVVGEARDKNQYWRAFRWTAATGMRDIGTTGGPMSAAYKVSRDGSAVVGKSLINGQSSSERAFRWTARKGMQDLQKELQSAGVRASDGWILSSAVAVSADGTVIVGYGLSPNRQWEPFRAVLPLPR